LVLLDIPDALSDILPLIRIDLIQLLIPHLDHLSERTIHTFLLFSVILFLLDEGSS
jgi:hypothetical protein